MSSLEPLRSLLFAPGSDPRKLARALASDADLAIADLEDAVAPGEKERARAAVAMLLAESGDRRPIAVRVNALETDLGAADLSAVTGRGAAAIVVPKSVATTLAGLDPVTTPPVIAIIETASGLQEIADIAAIPVVHALMFGQVDLAHELRLRPRVDGLELLSARTAVVVASAAAGLVAPLDGAQVDFRDLEVLRRECDLVRSLGFGGKACIHPQQLDVVHDAFSPSDEELAWARRVVETFDGAAAAGVGAIQLDGRMIDLPVVSRARQLLKTHAGA